MSSRGQTDLKVPPTKLVQVSDRATNRPDGSQQRNCLTSIYWVPTVKDCTLPLVENLSDHVHYYQGGQPFQYHVYDPSTQTLQTFILGPDIREGHLLQVPVEAGMWKCGQMLKSKNIEADYSLIAEAVGPGFDFHDFRFISRNDFEASGPSDEIKAVLKNFFHEDDDYKQVQKDKDFDSHYNEDDVRTARAQDRM